MTDRIDNQNLITAFRDSFPELERRYVDEVEFWEGERVPSNYDFVGFVFKPQFKQELEGGRITDFLRRSADFIERVCEGGDMEAVNVVWIKIFEWLLPRPEKMKIMWPIFGEHTKAAIRDAASRWGYAMDIFKTER